MKEVKKEVDITEANYKGYVELYKYKYNPYDNKFLISLITDGLKICGIVFLTTLLGSNVGLLTETSTAFLTVLFIGGAMTYYYKKIKTYDEININDILNEYPNIENIDCYNLSKSLEKVGILKENELDVKRYEIKIKGNKIIEETINEQKYEIPDLTADYIISEKEIEKVKTKIRKMNNR